MPRNFRTKGLILKSGNFNESDKIIVIFTPLLGKIEARARGARRILSAFCGHVNQLSICDFSLYKSTKGYFTITQCKQLKSFKKIKKDFELIGKTVKIAELINLNIGDEQIIPGMFEMTEELFENMGNSPRDSGKLIHKYLSEFLEILGLLPNGEITKARVTKIIREHLNLPQTRRSTRNTFFTRSTLSNILSN